MMNGASDPLETWTLCVFMNEIPSDIQQDARAVMMKLCGTCPVTTTKDDDCAAAMATNRLIHSFLG